MKRLKTFKVIIYLITSFIFVNLIIYHNVLGQSYDSKDELSNKVRDDYENINKTLISQIHSDLKRELNKWDNWIRDYDEKLNNMCILDTFENYSGRYVPAKQNIDINVSLLQNRELRKYLGRYSSIRLSNALFEYSSQGVLSLTYKEYELLLYYFIDRTKFWEFVSKEDERIGSALISNVPIDWSKFRDEEFPHILNFLTTQDSTIKKCENVNTAIIKRTLDHELAHMFPQDLLLNEASFESPSYKESKSFLEKLFDTDLINNIIMIYAHYNDPFSRMFQFAPSNINYAKYIEEAENTITNDFSEYPENFKDYYQAHTYYGIEIMTSDSPQTNIPLPDCYSLIEDNSDEAKRFLCDTAKEELRKILGDENSFLTNEANFLLELSDSNIKDVITKQTIFISEDHGINSYFFKEYPYIFLEISPDGDFVKHVVVISLGFKKIIELGLPKKDFLNFLNYQIEFQKQEHLIKEIQARQVASLMQVYLGDTTLSMWELSEEELAFLERYKLHGKSIFSKALEKYRIAKKLKAKGWNPEKIQQELKFALEYEFEGKKYFWPENGFKFTAN